MARVTQKSLRELVEHTRKLTGLPIVIQWAYGRPRLHLEEFGGTGLSDLSPRLPTGQMEEWIYAFRQGFAHGRKSRGTK